MFGQTYLIDMYECRKGACDDLELHYRFLEELCFRLGFTAMSAPIVIHGPSHFAFIMNGNGEWNKKPNGLIDTFKMESYPDKAGVSAWLPLIQSGMQVHSLEPCRFAALDVFTCGTIDVDTIRKLSLEFFGYSSFEESLVNRGRNYESK